MKQITIQESGMDFGPYPEGDVYRIEKSEVYAKIAEGVKIAEFLLLKRDGNAYMFWIVEAKSSSPRPRE